MLTKNYQSHDTIMKMAEAAFPGKETASITENTEGFCNVIYCVTFTDGTQTILKVTAKDRSGNTSNEINLMEAEVRAMRMVAAQTDIKVPRIYCYDTSRTICSGDYFFMEKLEGENLAAVRQNIPEEMKNAISREIGCIEEKLTHITNPEFGFLGDERRFDTAYEFTRFMLENLINDAAGKDVDLVYGRDLMLSRLEEDKDAFDEVPEASLVHWDLWEGNVFVRDGHVTGIIDWERAMWGDPLMDDRFRHHTRNDCFLEGFGRKTLSETEKTRIFWYDMILYLTMMVEVFVRGFEDTSQYSWAKDRLVEVADERRLF